MLRRYELVLVDQETNEEWVDQRFITRRRASRALGEGIYMLWCLSAHPALHYEVRSRKTANERRKH